MAKQDLRRLDLNGVVKKKLSLREQAQNTDNIIKYCFAHYPETKSNDKLLMLRVWEFQGLTLSAWQQTMFLHKLKHPETIRRRRQKIQEEAVKHGDTGYLPSEKVMEKRHKREEQMRLFYREERGQP